MIGFNPISLTAILCACLSPGPLPSSKLYNSVDDVRMHKLHNIDKTTFLDETTIIFSVEMGEKLKELYRCPAEKVLGLWESMRKQMELENLVSTVLVIKDDSIIKRHF